MSKATPPTTVKLETSDHLFFEYDYKIVKCFGKIREELRKRSKEAEEKKEQEKKENKKTRKDSGKDKDQDKAIFLSDVNSDVLNKIIEWATYHQDDPPPIEYDENHVWPTDDVCEWDKHYMKTDKGTLFELAFASQFLDIKGLQALTMKTVAIMIKNKTPEEIRQAFNIKNDFTEEEEEMLRKEYEWLKDREEEEEDD